MGQKLIQMSLLELLLPPLYRGLGASSIPFGPL